MPEDVRKEADQRAKLGLSVKEQAAAAAAAAAAESEAEEAVSLSAFLKRPREEPWIAEGRVSPSVENAAEWLKKQRTDDVITTAPAAAVSVFPTGGYHDYTPNDLLAPAPASGEDAEVAAEVAAAVAESDDANVNGYRHPHYQYAHYLSLSASEEAMARELAAVGGLSMNLSAGGPFSTNINMNTTGLNTSGGRNMNGAGGINAATLNVAGSLNMNTTGGLNMHNMNEL